MIGISDVQELVSFFKIFALRKGHLREPKRGAVVQTPFCDRTYSFLSNYNYIV